VITRKDQAVALKRFEVMDKEFWTVGEVVEIFDVDERFLADLEEEEVLCPICQDSSPSKLFGAPELEKLRLAKILVEEMGVNMAGVEIILRMRQTVFDMRKQFDVILEDLAHQLHEMLKE
jgi:MerR family transcriptional regulator/heat shock protein HspR